jgi:hypothetical protein
MSTAPSAAQTFPLRLDPIWRGPLLIIGVTPSRAHVTVDEDALILRFGLYEERIALANIAGAEEIRWPWYYGIGVKVGAQALGYVGSNKGVVRIKFKAPHPLAVLFKLRMPFSAIALSLRDPAGLIAALQARVTP